MSKIRVFVARATFGQKADMDFGPIAAASDFECSPFGIGTSKACPGYKVIPFTKNL